MTEYDLIVIGGGSGGIATANRAAEYGAKVAVIEEEYLGGTCVNVGCVPKKISWYAAKIKDAIDYYGPGYGFHAENVTFDYKKFVESRDAYVERSRASYTNRFEQNNVTVYHGKATLRSNTEVEVNGEVLTGTYILIATGCEPAMPEVEGAHLLEDSNDFFAWTELPQSVAIVGAGYIAVELAGVLYSLGVDTHLVVRKDRPLRQFDTMVSDALVQAMNEHGPTLHTNTTFDRYEMIDGKIACYQQYKQVLLVDKVVVAIGRRPRTQGLHLEEVGVELISSGHIKVDDNHRTTVSNIFAVGDVIGKVDLTPVAIRAGRQVAEYLFNGQETAKVDYTMIPTVVFSHPPIGAIGYTEEQAYETFGQERIKIYKTRFFSMYASAAEHREPCDFKLVCLDKEERIIGLHGICEGVDEMIQGFGVAMKMNATKADFDQVIAIHPTGSEEFVTMR